MTPHWPDARRNKMPNKKSETNVMPLLNDAQATTQDSAPASVDLNAPGIAKALSKRIADDIDEYCAKAYDDGHRNHLGGSLIGDSCSRKLWYSFRWCLHEKHSGRQQRLFNRGHREEERFIEWLEGIGAQVFYEDRDGFWYHAESDCYGISKEGETMDSLCEWVRPTDSNYLHHVSRAKADGLKFPQYRVSAVMGHFGGSLDGIAILPERYGIKDPVLLEFKTNGTGAGFNKLGDSGMSVAKPLHFAQTSTYGSDEAYRFTHVLYLNINKNDDSIHVEVVKLDWNLGDQMRNKAERIILSQVPPPRLSDNPTFRDCGWCAMKDICHKGAIPEKNCRSCAHARPVENKGWWCDLHSPQANENIPKEVIPKGCDSYFPITATVKND
ncbi:hypothetical protein [Pseudomonas phage KP1]|uniref:Exonuclease n=1 Tax=Pseudomonas phage KP1 TaxID=2562463 RepID=A0A6G5QAN4_9CAUD|nr:Cas4-domain exonuclease [Pseudomonas phage KP1]QBZ71737.1 hypothetical protein [Pseudomonas phage KP1]